MINFENLNKFKFLGIGSYEIPSIEPVTEYPTGEFIPMNYAKSESHPEDKNVHCFVDDYQFIRYWNNPDMYIPKLSQFRSVCSPDFSTFPGAKMSDAKWIIDNRIKFSQMGKEILNEEQRKRRR